MRGWPWLLIAAAALAGGCSGGQMLNRGDRAPAFPTGLRMVDGSAAALPALTSRGPLVLVLIRGFV